MSEPAGLEHRYLICRARGFLCALPLADVVETMRPLPVRRLGDAPPFIRGLSVIRGAPVPVVDVCALLDDVSDGQPARFVTLRAGGRVAALAVDEILGVFRLAPASLGALPPLLDRARPGAVSLLGTLDGTLLAVLQGGLLVPEPVWESVSRGAAA